MVLLLAIPRISARSSRSQAIARAGRRRDHRASVPVASMPAVSTAPHASVPIASIMLAVSTASDASVPVTSAMLAVSTDSDELVP